MLNRIKIFPVARRNYCHKIKPQVYVHVFTSISMLQNSLSNTTSLTALEILQLLLHFPWHSMTLAVFHDFPGLENGLTKCHDFPWLSRKSGHPDYSLTRLYQPYLAKLTDIYKWWSGQSGSGDLASSVRKLNPKFMKLLHISLNTANYIETATANIILSTLFSSQAERPEMQ